jgi:hypothetical protein
MMTVHRRSALPTAGDVLNGGTDPSVHETANDKAVEQCGEIRRMAELDLG